MERSQRTVLRTGQKERVCQCSVVMAGRDNAKAVFHTIAPYPSSDMTPEQTVSLRPTTLADLPILFEFQKDPEAVHMAAFTVPDPSDREAYITKWTRLLGDPTITSRTILLEGERVVGSVGIWYMKGEPQVTYGIERSLWGRGIVTAALRLFLEGVSVRPLHAHAAFDNKGSMRVLEKCGFSKKGTERGFANARGMEIEEAVYVLR